MNTWEGKDGQPRTGLSVSAWRVEILGRIGKSRPAKVGGEHAERFLSGNPGSGAEEPDRAPEVTGHP